jgi:6-phosphogluconolactonase
MELGSGPRHLVFHPDKNLVYILGEMSATVTACTFDPASGALSIINTSSIVEDDFAGKRQSAAVRVHPNGKFVYASNRDDGSNLAVFSVDSDGGLTQTQIIRDIPYWPRDFNITPDGKFILVAGARSNEIALYKVNPETGFLSGTGVKTSLPGITSIAFAK